MEEQSLVNTTSMSPFREDSNKNCLNSDAFDRTTSRTSSDHNRTADTNMSDINNTHSDSSIATCNIVNMNLTKENSVSDTSKVNGGDGCANKLNGSDDATAKCSSKEISNRTAVDALDDVVCLTKEEFDLLSSEEKWGQWQLLYNEVMKLKTLNDFNNPTRNTG